MKPNDTNVEAQRALYEIYSQMSVNCKTNLFFEAYQMGRILAIAGIKEQDHSISDDQLWHKWAKRHLGEKLFNKVYGSDIHE